MLRNSRRWQQLTGAESGLEPSGQHCRRVQNSGWLVNYCPHDHALTCFGRLEEQPEVGRSH